MRRSTSYIVYQKFLTIIQISKITTSIPVTTKEEKKLYEIQCYHYGVIVTSRQGSNFALEIYLKLHLTFVEVLSCSFLLFDLYI